MLTTTCWTPSPTGAVMARAAAVRARPSATRPWLEPLGGLPVGLDGLRATDQSVTPGPVLPRVPPS